jgi:hypothetical protein
MSCVTSIESAVSGVLSEDSLVVDRLESGDIEVYIVDQNYPNGIELSLTEYCCNLLNDVEFPSITGFTYSWDDDYGKCKWLKSVDCNNLPTFNVTLNPQLQNGDGVGANFKVDSGENCVLEVKFDYMFHFNCEDVLAVSATTDSLGNYGNAQLDSLYEQLANQTTILNNAQSDIDGLDIEFSYVIPYEPTFLCVTEAGVPLLRQLIENFFTPSSTAWQEYLNGGITAEELELSGVSINFYISSEEPEVQDLYYTFCNNGQELIDNNLTYLSTIQNNNQIIENTQNQISVTQAQIDFILANNPDVCLTETDVFERLNIGMSIDIQNPQSESLVDTIYSQQIFNVGQDNLLQHFINNTGFTGFYLGGYKGVDCTSTACDALAKVMVEQLIAQGDALELFTGDTIGQKYTQLINLIGENYFDSGWLRFETVINDPVAISGITNQLINLSVQVLDHCANFSILIDRIEINQICERKVNDDILVSTNPKFNITKVIDNKKSWVANITPEDRYYNLPLRLTDYDTNHHRLVINTKETDLNVSIANGIETDIWCYVNENQCILKPCGDVTTTIITSGSCVGSITGITNWTGGTTSLPTLNSGVDPQFVGNIYRINQAASGAIPASAFTTSIFSGCSFVHKIDRAYTQADRFSGAWIVGNYDGNVYWYANYTISGGTETTYNYSDSISGQTGCETVASAITAYNAFNGTNLQTIYWDGVGCKFDQVLTGATTATTITNDCCCGDFTVTATTITGGTVTLPPEDVYSCGLNIGDSISGGTVFWVNPNNSCDALIVSNANIGGYFSSYQWTDPLICGGQFFNMTNDGISGGDLNTNIFLSQCTDPSSAVYIASQYLGGGESGWYLPNMYEFSFIVNNIPYILDLDTNYWTSTENNEGNATYYNFEVDPSIFAIGKKSIRYKVRAIKRINNSPCLDVYDTMIGVTGNTSLFEIENTECTWIYKFDSNPSPTTFNGFWLAGMPDGTVGVFQNITISGVTATTVDYSHIVTKECCEAYDDALRDIEVYHNLGRHLERFRWDESCQACLYKKCTEEVCLDFNNLLTSEVTGATTVNNFNEIINSELINVRCRKISSSYPVLQALYRRYLNSKVYCDQQSSEFTYDDMINFAGLIGNYWIELFEQVIPSTTIWTSNYIYGNTLYDQQKFKYRSGSVFPYSVSTIYEGILPMPATSQNNVPVHSDVYVVGGDGLCKSYVTCDNIYYYNGDCGSEFIGAVTIGTNTNNTTSSLLSSD